MGRLGLMLILCGCAVTKSGEQSLALDKQETQIVKDEGGWTAEFTFAPPDAATPLRKSPSKAPAAVSPLPGAPSWMAWPMEFDHGPLLDLKLSGKLPVTTTTTGTVRVDEHSAWSVVRKLGLTLWPYLLGLALAAGAGLVLWKLKPPWMNWAWKLLRLA
jgi:hypothetical protein